MQRRAFLKGITAAAAIGAGPYGHGAAFTQSRERVREFRYSDVTLTGGPLKTQYDRIHKHFLSLDNDRLLKVYRQRAGLPAPGEDMGGWYDADGFVPGHTLGQYISGLARYYKATGDPAARAKVQALVDGFGATLGPGGYPFASEKAAITWPCYILDKYEIGLLDAYQLAGVTNARGLITRVIQGATPYIPDHTYDRGPNSPKQAPYDEPYILPENLFNSYEVTGEKHFLDMARLYLLNQEYFDPLAQGKNLLPGKHAYSHVIALSSAAKAYLVLGDPKYLAAIRNAWDMIETTQQFASGGWGPQETFVPPGEGKLGESLTKTRDHFETPCGCYAHMKLARYLLRFTGEARYGDGLERVLYNTILGAKDPDQDGDYFYYSDYHAEAKKGYYKKKWPCCSGTLVQTVADYVISAYFQSESGIYVNLFTPSVVRWSKNAVPIQLAQTTNYPQDETSEILVSVPRPTEFTISIRIPGWLQKPAQLSVNGKDIDVPSQPGTFATFRRRWRRNDTVQIRFPLFFRTEPVDDVHRNTVALLRGPLMYVAVDPPPAISEKPVNIPNDMRGVAHEPGAFELATTSEKLRFKPFYTVGEETYNTYFSKQAS